MQGNEQQNQRINELFKNFVEGCLESSREVFVVKASDYSGKFSPFENFEIASVFISLIPNDGSKESSCWYLMAKHLASVVQILRRYQNGQGFSVEYLREKFGDLRNYLIILEAMLAGISFEEVSNERQDK